jgi:aerobic carbon-monoxide dehydrogenase large subunit
MSSQTDHSPFARVEDEALITGRGRYIADAPQPGMLYAAFVRSPHAAARITSVDIEAATSSPGVIAVLTAADIEKAGIGSISNHPPVPGAKDGRPLAMPYRPTLAGEKVAHVGEPVVAVIAQSELAALDGAELVNVEYDSLPAVTDVRDAVKPDAPQVHKDVPGNIAIDWAGPAADPAASEKAVNDAFAEAAHVARITVVNQRLVVAAMEPRGATAWHDAAANLTTLRTCSQGAGVIRDALANFLKCEKGQIRVLTEDVGGAFGMKTGVYPEYTALIAAARVTGKPVHWMSTRSEAFSTDNQGRDGITDGELALDERGKFLALRVRHLANMGAYMTYAGARLATYNFSRCFPTVYRVPRIDASVRCVFTHSTPTGPYRGAGRPEANYLMERLVEEAARVTGIDRVALRKRNFIPRSAMPFKTDVQTTYDSGEFPAVFEKALTLADYAGFKKRKREAARRGKYRGFGISCFLEHSGGVPTEGALLEFPGGEKLVIALGVQSTGQGHATVYPRLVAEKLGILPSQVIHRHGDSLFEIKGGPAVASRSTITAGTATVRAVETMLAKAKTIAAQVLEAAESDIIYRSGLFEVVGTDRMIPLFTLAERASEMKKRGEIPETLDTKVAVDTPQTFPNGCHIAEIEIDPDTGHAELIAYCAVDDAGNVLDHTLVEGQIHGGLAQGLGQALFERAVYEDGSGQLVTGSFMDYAMPRAHHMPPVLKTEDHAVPATTNPLGVKGVGEAGTTASIAAIMNAIADAIPNGAADHMDMPATVEKIWAACRKAKA